MKKMLGAGLLLLGVYAAVIAAGDSRAWSGSDAGGKAATVASMVEARSWRPDVGYWAADSDPSGRYHPLLYTSRHGARWFQVTSLPLPLAGKPLWEWFGPPGLLLLPVLGAVVAAFAARSIARALGAPSGWFAFAAVGLGPLLCYAADAWEHAPAVGLALVALSIALHAGPARWGALAIGVALGTAGVLRTEVMVVAFAFAVVLAFDRHGRKALGLAPGRALVGLSVAAAIIVANAAVEHAVLGEQGRVVRSGAEVAAAGHQLSERAHDGALTTFGLFPSPSGPAITLGLIATLGMVCLGRVIAGRRPPSLPERGAVAVAVALVGARMFAGPGFVPGALTAAPLAAVSLGLGTTVRSRPLVIAAAVSFPLVWLTSPTGQLVAQWGGRYLLLPASLLAIAAAPALERARSRPAVLLAVGLVAAVAVLTGVWHAQRTNAFAQAAEAVVDVPPERVVVFRLAHFGREAGAFYGRGRWLRADRPSDVQAAFDVCRRERVREVDLVTLAAERPSVPAGWVFVARRHVDIFGERLTVATYRSALAQDGSDPQPEEGQALGVRREQMVER